jgi:adenylate cyclase
MTRVRESGRDHTPVEKRPSLLRRVVEYPLSFGEYAGEPADQRGRRRVMVGALCFSIPFIALPSLAAPGPWVSAMYLTKASAHLLTALALRRFPRNFGPLVHFAFAAGLATDIAVTVMMGGVYESGLQIAWSIIAVPGALIAFSVRTAVVWFGIYSAGVLGASIAASWVTPLYEEEAPEAEGALTLVLVTALVLIVTAYFVRQRDRYQRRSDDLLNNILPTEIAARLKDGSDKIADHFDEVTVLFADVVGFTPMSATMTPADLVGLLDDIFSDIDDLVEKAGLEKIKTVGDEYMVAAGVPVPRPDHARAAADLALRINHHMETKSFAGHPIRFRIGLHTGPVVAGVIGRRKFAYDLWGDVVNTASRMESHGVPGRIQMSDATRAALGEAYICERRGVVGVKGKGEMTTWFLIERA